MDIDKEKPCTGATTLKWAVIFNGIMLILFVILIGFLGFISGDVSRRLTYLERQDKVNIWVQEAPGLYLPGELRRTGNKVKPVKVRKK